MANQEHLNILTQGVDSWNLWRSRNKVVPELSGATLTGRNLSAVNFRFARLDHADLRDAELSDADLTLADLSHADLKGANLAGAKLFYAIAYDADLSNAQLVGTDFRFAELLRVKMNNASMGWTIFGENDLGTVEGLDSVTHSGPTDVGMSTIYRSSGRVPEAFLRRAGIAENLVEHISLLTKQAIEFYKCFISFTEADDGFAEKLYNDLQTAGVRCWRWKEDAKWGQALMHSVDEAISLYDKLIVICSEASLRSPPVIREIERALQKEDGLGRQSTNSEVLFPVRLDDFLFDGWNHHRKADVIAKTVGDFRRWSDSESYQKAFARLIRDLRAE